MTKPSHVEAFEFFTENSQSEIRDFIAFGLFMQSEDEWASQNDKSPTDAEYRRYHQNLLTPLQRDRLRAGADDVLRSYAIEAIRAANSAFLSQALAQYRLEASKGYGLFRKFGVLEAILGALAWTLVLIFVSIVAQRFGIDLLEYYKHAAAMH
jgi:hypothetical protein